MVAEECLTILYEILIARQISTTNKTNNIMKKTIKYGDYEITKEENGSIRILKNGVPQENAKAALREIASSIGLKAQESWNTQQFGSKLISAIEELPASGSKLMSSIAQKVSETVNVVTEQVGSAISNIKDKVSSAPAKVEDPDEEIVEGEGAEESMKLCKQIKAEMQKLGLDRFIIDGGLGYTVDGNIHIVDEDTWEDYYGDYESFTRIFGVDNGSCLRCAYVKGLSIENNKLLFHILFMQEDDNGAYAEDEELSQFSLKELYDRFKHLDDFGTTEMLETYLQLLQGSFEDEPIKWEVKD